MYRQLITAFSALSLSASAMSEPAFGTWQTEPDDNGNYGHIVVSPCADKLCGELVQSFSANGEVLESENIGRNIIWDVTAQGDGRYDGGKIWSPDRDKTYTSKMELVDGGNGLAVEGCILFICRDGGTWKRVE